MSYLKLRRDSSGAASRRGTCGSEHRWDHTIPGFHATIDDDYRTMYYRFMPLVDFEAEQDGNSVTFTPQRKSTFGLDFEGRMGRFGRLLAVKDYTDDPNDPNNVICFYDGAGNAGQNVLLENDGGTITPDIISKVDYGERIVPYYCDDTEAEKASTCSRCGECFKGYKPGPAWPYPDGYPDGWDISDTYLCGCGSSGGRGSLPGLVVNEPAVPCVYGGMDTCQDCYGPTPPGMSWASVNGMCVQVPNGNQTTPPPPHRPNNPDAPVNGCSSPVLIGDAPTGVSFTSACNEHDRCYGTCGNPKEVCDSEFYNDLLAACDAGTRDALSRDYCHFWAYAFYNAVKGKGGPYYANAQANRLPPIDPPPPPEPVHPCAELARSEFNECMIDTGGVLSRCEEDADAVYDQCCQGTAAEGLPCPEESWW